MAQKPSAKQVRKGLFIGNRAAAESIAGKGITHLLSVGAPLGDKAPAGPTVHLAFNDVLDEDTYNILQHLPAGVKFISDALKNDDAKVLVHCEAGRSRSAAMIAAYIIKSDGTFLEDAIMALAQVNPNICPNMGFCDQLLLYQQMGCKINTRHPGYKQFAAQQLAMQRIGEGYIEGEALAEADPAEGAGGTEVRCRKCRLVLATAENLLPHATGTGQTAFSHRKRDAGQPGGASPQCTSLFLEPMKWMAGSGIVDGYSVQGKLQCGKCEARLGAFDWSGEQCSCGAWVTPAFQIHAGKVDVMQALNVPQVQRPVLQS